MKLSQVFWAFIFPPFAVAHKGCLTMLVVLFLALLGWLPGVIAVFLILNNEK